MLTHTYTHTYIYKDDILKQTSTDITHRGSFVPGDHEHQRIRYPVLLAGVLVAYQVAAEETKGGEWRQC